MELDLTAGLSQKELSLHPMCRVCGYAMGGQDSWDGIRCKCGHSAPTFQALFTRSQA